MIVRLWRLSFFAFVLSGLLILLFSTDAYAIDSLTITTPVNYQVIQRNTNNAATISITGTYVGTPTTIEAAWNGGSYSVIDATPAGGSFSGELANQPGGQGTLSVRFSNDTSIVDTKSYVGIGDIFVIAGQSNASGRGTNNQTYSHATIKAALFGNDDVWKELVDPTDSNTNRVDSVSSDPSAGGSMWPPLATHFLEDQSVPVAFVPTAKKSTYISQWLPNESNHGDTTTLYGSMHRRITVVGGVKAVLFLQGESDASTGSTRQDYKDDLNTFVNNVYADFGVRTVIAQMGDISPVASEGINAVRLAQLDVWNTNGYALAGPSLYDIDIGDPIHFVTDSDMQISANRWWMALESAYYNGTSGRGPRLSKAEYDSSKTEILLTFESSSLPLLPDSTQSGYTVKVAGVEVTPASIHRVSANQVLIILQSPAVGDISVSLGSGNAGKGATVPTDSSTYPLPAEIFIDYVVTPMKYSNATPEPSAKPGWAKHVMAGPNYNGPIHYISGDESAIGAMAYIASNTHRDDLYLHISSVTAREAGVLDPTTSGFEQVGAIYRYQLLSAFNGYPVSLLDGPATIVLPYVPIQGNTQTTHIAYWNSATNRWEALPRVIRASATTVAATTRVFSYFTVVKSQEASPVPQSNKTDDISDATNVPSVAGTQALGKDIDGKGRASPLIVLSYLILPKWMRVQLFEVPI